MITEYLCAAALSISVLPVSVHAADQIVSDDSAKEERVCRRQQPEIGSRIAKKPVCRTAEEWAEIDRAHSDEHGRWERNRRSMGTIDN
ncbi:hypothetical protein KCG44_12875 [Pacificimonas sp. WHA3]|uniref:Secreted protein n=1 Tax=Pacificimonas pallii TaxID=2827236 RepID=A0ABS6SGY4_9SPHN|nr:hypothetical protein [Pacificimonas pallii]MBV7257679.1 hypothetical protein [Pacificimonas pallii]